MPHYLFKHPTSEEVIEVSQKMEDEHVYVDDHGIEWNRVFVAPNADVRHRQDGSLESFMEYTKGKKGTVGDLWEASREAGEIRENKLGKDTVKKKHFKKYSEKRRGIKHQSDDS